MEKVVLKAKQISKKYQLGLTGHRDLRATIRSGFSKKKKKENANFWALKEVSFSVRRGETLGIIGSNGAGKSTLLKIFSQITVPTSGSVEIDGRVASLLEVGTGFHPELTGRENIFLNGTILGMGREEIKRKFDEIVEFSGVADFLETPVKRYSSGMAVRLAFSVAAHLEPEILLVDEVLSVGDLAFQKKCLRKMDEVADSGRTILFVSHNMRTIKQLCRRGILLEKGAVVLDDTIDKVVDTYVKKYTEQTAPVKSFDADPQKIVSITQVNLSNDRGDWSRQFHFGEPLQVSFQLKCLRSVCFYPIIGIETHDGIRLAMAKGQAVDFSVEMNPGESTEIKANFPNLNLTPGEYRILLRVVEGKGHIIDQQSHAISFEVLEIPFQNTVPFSGGQGLIRPIPKWSLSTD